MPKVSVLMPVYNAEDYLAEAIDSIISQTFTDWELIIGDDGSTDATESVIKSYKDSRISFYKNIVNKGHTETKYSLLEKSSGEYIAFLDADDVSYPDRLRIQVDFMDNNPEYGLCGTWGEMIAPNGKKIKKISYINCHEYIKCALVFNTAFLQSSIMVKRNLMRDFYLDKEILLVEDYNFECLVSRVSKVENIKEELVKYRWHDSNISNTKQEILNNLNKKIYSRELLILGIDATDYELDLHNAIRDKNSLDISNKEFFAQLKVWMRKLASANKEKNIYNHNIFLATICFRWMYACKERSDYGKMLLFPVSLNLSAFCKLIRLLYMRS